MSRLEARPYLVLAIGVAAVSSAAIWVRLSNLPPLVLAFYRLGFSAAALWPLWLAGRRQGRGAGAPAEGGPHLWRLWAAVAGVSLSAHWSVWFASLELTSVLSSTVLVTTQPLFVVLVSWLLWRQRISRGQSAALSMALLGGVVIASADALAGGSSGAARAPAGLAGESLYGDALALLAAALVSVYLLVGQRLRARVALLDYLTVVYSAGALALLAVARLLNLPLWGYPSREVWVGLGIAAVPTLIGHSALNAVVARLGASTVATAVLGEPVGASVLALVLFREWPTLLHWLGAAMILAGIYLFSLPTRNSSRREVQPSAVP